MENSEVHTPEASTKGTESPSLHQPKIFQEQNQRKVERVRAENSERQTELQQAESRLDRAVQDSSTLSQTAEESVAEFRQQAKEKIAPFAMHLRNLGKKEGEKFVVSDQDVATIKEALKEALNLPSDSTIEIGVGSNGDALATNIIEGTLMMKNSQRGAIRFSYNVHSGTLWLDELRRVHRSDVQETVRKLASTPRPLEFHHYFSGTTKQGETVVAEEAERKPEHTTWSYEKGIRVTIEKNGKKQELHITEVRRTRGGGNTTIEGTVMTEVDGMVIPVKRTVWISYKRNATLDGEELIKF